MPFGAWFRTARGRSPDPPAPATTVPTRGGRPDESPGMPHEPGPDRVIERLADLHASRSRERYAELFRMTPVATWEQDFSRVESLLREWRAAGVEDLAAHFEEHPDLVPRLISLIEVVDANPAAARLMGVSTTEELLGPLTPELVGAQSFSAWAAKFEAMWRHEGSARVEGLLGLRRNGESFHGILEWHAPRDGGELDYARSVVVIIDVTDLVEAEQRMQRALESKDEFLAAISHELRTPLTSVLGFAEVLLAADESVGEDEREAMLRLIASRAGTLADIVDDLLVATRLELGQLTVVAKACDLLSEVRSIIDRMTPEVGDIHLDAPTPGPIAVLADPLRARQVVRNLVANAARHGGDQVRVEVRRLDTAVAVDVWDDGPGVDRDVVDRMFDKYYRAGTSLGLPGSLGLGLTVARDLARLMGGDLAHERRGSWTVFSLTLPAAPGV